MVIYFESLGFDAIIFLNRFSTKKVYFKDNQFFKKFLYPFVKKLRKIVLFRLGKNSQI